MSTRPADVGEGVGSTGFERELSVPQYVAWGLGSLGSATLLNAVTFMILFYLSTVLGMSPALAGWLIFLSKIYDMITDPAMGVISDRTDSRWGRRRPYLLLGAFVSATSFLLLFNASPEWSGAWLTAWCVGALLLYATGYTIFNVPYMAMPAEMTGSYHERSTLMSYRVIFASVGITIGGALAPSLVSWAGGGAAGYSTMSWVVAAIIFAAMTGAFLGTARVRFTSSSDRSVTPLRQARLVLRNRPFVILMSIKLVQLLGVASTMTSLLFFVVYILGRSESALGQFGLFSTIGTVVSMPLWLRLSRRLEKRDTYQIAVAGYVLGVLTWLLATPDETLLVFSLRALWLGVFTGGILLMGISLLPDTIEYDYRRTGLRREGMFASFYSFVEKFSFAIGPAVIGTLLSLMGFDRDAGADQSESARLAIVLGAAVIPAAAAAASMLLIRLYDLDEARLKTAAPEGGAE